MWTGPFWMGGMWIFPLIVIVVVLFVFFMVFGSGGCRPPWGYRNQNYYRNGEKDTAFEILKKRYANGEITREEFDKIKNDLL